MMNGVSGGLNDPPPHPPLDPSILSDFKTITIDLYPYPYPLGVTLGGHL